MNEPNLHVHIEDGRTYLETTQAQYDVVAIDAFQQPYIPFQLTTREFFTIIRSHLSSNGVVALNTAHTTQDFRLVQAFINTMSQIFPSVYVFNVPGTFNTEIMATVQPTSITTFAITWHSSPPQAPWARSPVKCLRWSGRGTVMEGSSSLMTAPRSNKSPTSYCSTIFNNIRNCY